MSTYLKSFLIQANINVDSTLFPSRAVRLILPAALGKVTYQVQVHTCNCIPDLGRLSAGCNKQQSGTLTEFPPPSPSSPETVPDRIFPFCVTGASL